jgi:hypothetical protein
MRVKVVTKVSYQSLTVADLGPAISERGVIGRVDPARASASPTSLSRSRALAREGKRELCHQPMGCVIVGLLPA